MKLNVRVLSWFVYILAFISIAYSGLGIFYSLVPISYWLEYESVRPAKDVFKTGEPLFFISTLEINRQVNIEYHDVLFCKEKDRNFIRHSEMNTTAYRLQPQGNEEVIWPYTPLIYKPATCYLSSTILIPTRYGNTRNFVMRGPTFEVVNAD